HGGTFQLPDGNIMAFIGSSGSAPTSGTAPSLMIGNGDPVSSGGQRSDVVASSPAPPPTTAPPPRISSSATSTTTPSSSSPNSSSTSTRSTTSSVVALVTPRSSSASPPRTTTIASVISSSGGVASTVFITTTQGAAVGATGMPSDSADLSSSSHIGLIVGCAVGVPLGLAAVALLSFFLWRRGRKQAYKNSPSSQLFMDSPESDAGKFKDKPDVPQEIDSRMVNKPASELDAQSVLASPNPSTTLTPPPTYSISHSPRTSGNEWGRFSYGDATAAGIENRLSHNSGGGYQPYRSPAAELPG
ncbi:hypothetical protein LTS18_006875, partial [Coniosporium uncinatum]